MPTPKTEPKASAGKPALYGRVREILAAARAGIARTVNTTQVMANWLIGRAIVEEEQRGRRRAGYGTAMLVELAERLRVDFGAGYGVDNLELFRRFYQEYPQLLAEAAPETISYVPRRKSATSAATPTAWLVSPTVGAAAWQTGRLSPGLSWMHYRRLLLCGGLGGRACAARPPRPHCSRPGRHGRIAQGAIRQLKRLRARLPERLPQSLDGQGVAHGAPVAEQVGHSLGNAEHRHRRAGDLAIFLCSTLRCGGLQPRRPSAAAPSIAPHPSAADRRIKSSPTPAISSPA